ncbi:hypothetical protein GW916_14145 [bacterium]|nr:hypothetical protein [bacterium]
MSVNADFDFEEIGESVNTTRHKLAGTVYVNGAPAERFVLALDRRTMSYFGATSSHPVTGEWSLINTPERPERSLMVIAMDNAGEFNAEVFDYVSQVATI